MQAAESWPSNSSERGTKHAFPVNLAQIRIHKQKSNRQRQKNSQKQNLTQFTACGSYSFLSRFTNHNWSFFYGEQRKSMYTNAYIFNRLRLIRPNRICRLHLLNQHIFLIASHRLASPCLSILYNRVVLYIASRILPIASNMKYFPTT